MPKLVKLDIVAGIRNGPTNEGLLANVKRVILRVLTALRQLLPVLMPSRAFKRYPFGLERRLGSYYLNITLALL